MRKITSLVLILSLGALIDCSATQLGTSQDTQAVEAETEQPIVARVPPQRVPHDGPMEAMPQTYDCGEIPVGGMCAFDSLLRNTSTTGELVIQQISQTFSPAASVRLEQPRMGWNIELPHTTAVSEQIRLLFQFGRSASSELVGGSIFIQYDYDNRLYRLEIPVGAY